MVDFCKGQPFWDTDLTWSNSSWLHLTECFKDTVIELTPCAWLLLTSPFYISYLLSLPPRPHKMCWLFVLKLLFSGYLTGLIVIDMILFLSSGNFGMNDISRVIWVLTMIVYSTLVVLERSRGQVRSMILFTFWILASISITTLLYSDIMLKQYDRNTFRFTVTMLRYGLTCSLFVFTCFAEYHWRKSRRHNPEISASALSWTAYTWLESLMRKGFRKPMTEDDVFELILGDTSSSVISRFLKNWHRGESQSVDKKESWFQTPEGKKTFLNSTADEKTNLITTSFIETNGATAKSYSGSSYEMEIIGDKTKEENNDEIRKPTFFKTLVRTFWWETLYSHAGMVIFVAMNLLAPFILGYLIDYTKDMTEPKWHGYFYMIGFLAIKILSTIFNQSSQYLSNRLAIRVRSTAIAAIFRKSLSMSSEAKRGSTLGEIVNLMSVDTNHLELFLNYSYWMWMSVILLIFAVYLLYLAIGISMLAGLGFICLLLCVNVVVSQRMRKYQDQMMIVKDERLKMMGEVLQGIKVIKLYGWEPLFIKKIIDIRQKELKILFKHAIFDGLDTFAYTASTFWMTFFMLATFVLIDPSHYLDSKRAFLTINYINLVRMAIVSLPILIRYTVKSATSIQRINKFLQAPDLDPKNLQRDSSDNLALRIINADFGWKKSSETILKDINLEVRPGQLVAVVGTVGAGKSSLLSAVLGEMSKEKGYFNLNSSVAYVPQQAWIQNNTIKENIKFGRKFDNRLYDKVIDACALKQDLEILPSGDRTEIGEKGINLSGGQKQRVSLARAVYSQADIYLFDDPLSAVDSQVGQHIFKHVMSRSGLLKDKTRLLVTHGLHWLSEADLVVVMHDGKISEMGTFDDLVGHDGAFAHFLAHYLTERGPDGTTTDDMSDFENDSQTKSRKLFYMLTSDGEVSDEPSNKMYHLKTSSNRSLNSELRSQQRKSKSNKKSNLDVVRRSISKSNIHHSDIGLSEMSDEDERHHKIDKSKLTTVEGLAGGKVNWSIYLELLKGYGVAFAVITAFLILGFHTAYNASFVWLTVWNDDDKLSNFSAMSANSTERYDRNQYYVYIYTAFGLVQTLCCLTYSAILQARHVTTSRVLHAQLLDSVMRAPMSFFDTTPMGRILNRFSQDLEILDSEIFLQLEVYIEHAMFALGIVVIISYTFPVFVAVLVPVVGLFYIVQQFYIRTSCQLRRIASNKRSPVLAHFSETLSGVNVIRAHQQEVRFILDSETKVDNFQQSMMASYAAQKWIQTRLDILSYIFLLAVTLFATLYRGDVQPGLVGLTVTYVLMITNELTMMTRMSCDLETNVVSVERMREYSSIKSEAAWSLEGDSTTLKNWPSRGQIKFIDYSTRYREGLDLVLNGVTFTVNAGEKIGIVGRTGAGKSSMVLSLFRLIEAVSGHIVIDDMDISKVGLHALRRGLTILPQDPVLFAGSLRMNLDPFDEKSDEDLWQSLEHAHLKAFVETLPEQLDHDVGEGGDNLSMGQRQLVCLARTLLRKTKILILDEATAAVDMETDELIQNTIKTAFSDCTVLTIAHRINTVMDYDRILVLQSGQVIEFDSPEILMSDITSVFYSMARQGGVTSSSGGSH